MKVAIVLNGISLNKSRFYNKILPALQQVCKPDVFESQSKKDAISVTAKLMSRRYDYILAAGGDGTLNQVLNGMLRDYEPPSKLPVLGIIPLGGGNDFARALGISGDPAWLPNALRGGNTRTIDVGEVRYTVTHNGQAERHEQGRRLFINVVDVGMGPDVLKRVAASARALGTAMAYYTSILTTFFTFKPAELTARGDDWEWHNPVRTLAIANASYYGNGLCVAPDAKLDDGEFNIFACGRVSVLDFILKTFPMKAGKKLSHREISYFRSRQVNLISGDKKIAIEADGEVLGELPASVKMADIRVKILVS